MRAEVQNESGVNLHEKKQRIGTNFISRGKAAFIQYLY
jgi:hypothetical protein